MLRRTPLFSATLPQVLGSGLQPDQHLLQKLLWETAENVSFVNGKVRRRKPDELIFDAGANCIRGISQLQDSNGVRWIWAASGGDVKRWYGPSVESILTGQTWTEDAGVLYPASFWSMLPYGNWMLLSNGHGQIKVYDPDNAPAAALGDSPSDVVKIMKKLGFIMAIGYGAAKTRVGWSDSDDISVWTAAEDNNAGSLTIAEFNTPIRSAEKLGENIAIFAEDQMATLSYIGEPFYFGYKIGLDGIGAVGQRATAGDGKNVIGFSRNGAWWTDGLSFKYFDEGVISNYFQDNINWDQASKIVVARNDVTRCFDFSFPMGASTDPSEAWSYDPRVNSWYEIPVFSDKDERVLFSAPITGDLTGNVSYDGTEVDGGALNLVTKPIVAQLQDESGLRDLHNAVRVHEVDMLVKSASNVEFHIGSCNEADGDFNWLPWRTLNESAVTHKMQHGLPAGVYTKLAFRSVADNWDLDLQGFVFFGQVEGTKGR